MDNDPSSRTAGARAEFRRVAEGVVGRAAEVLRTTVLVCDGRGLAVAGSDPDLVGRLCPAPADPPGWTRVPFRLDDEEADLVAAAPVEGEAFSPRLVGALVELLVNQVAVVDRLPNAHALKDRLISDLVHGARGDQAAVLREAKVLGMDLSTPRAAILVDAADYVVRAARGTPGEERDADMRRRAHLLIGSIVGFFKLPDDTICASIGDGELVVLKASNSRNLANWVDPADGGEVESPSWANLAALKRAAEALLARLRADTQATITVGIGRYHPGIAGLSLSYGDARAALSLGRRLRGLNQVHCLDGLGVGAFVGVADERTKVDLATHLLSPLDHEPELLRSLDAYFGADCCPSAAADRLAVHRNTLGYRLDKIRMLTGLDPRRFDDAVQVRLALVLRSLAETTAAVQMH